VRSERGDSDGSEDESGLASFAAQARVLVRPSSDTNFVLFNPLKYFLSATRPAATKSSRSVALVQRRLSSHISPRRSFDLLNAASPVPFHLP